MSEVVEGELKCSGLATFCRAALSQIFLRTKAAINISQHYILPSPDFVSLLHFKLWALKLQQR